MKKAGHRRTTKARNSALTIPGVTEHQWLHWVVPTFIAAVTLAVFYPALFNGFVNWDDDVMVVDNPHFRGLGLTQLSWMFGTFHSGHYQPLSWMTLGLDFLLWGTNPFGYHLTSVVLHAVNAVIFYFFCRLLFTTVFASACQETGWELEFGAALGATLFALHPLRVESVVWATERRDVLSGGFFLVAVYCYLRANGAGRPAKHPGKFWLWLAFAAQLFSLLSKATAITFPLVLVILDIYPLRRLNGSFRSWLTVGRRHVLWEKLPFLLLSVAFGVIALLAQHSAGALRPVQEYFLSDRLGQGLYGICFYLWKTIWPTQLSPLYEMPYDFAQLTPLFVACGVIATLVSLVVYLSRNRLPCAAACWAYYVILLAPVLGVAQSGPQLVADRYSYLSCLGWAALIGGSFFSWIVRFGPAFKPARVIAGIVAVVVSAVSLGFMTRNQMGFWHDSETLWKHALAVEPDTAIAAYNLAKVYESSGNWQESVELYRRAVAINPTYADAHYNLALLLARQGKSDEAISHYREALKFKPNDVETHNNLGQLLALSGDADAAFREFQQALALDPQFAKAYFNLGRLFVRAGELTKAIEYYQRALTLLPDTAEIHAALGEAYARLGNLDKAVFQFSAAVKLRPELADVQLALSQLLEAQRKKGDSEVFGRRALGTIKARNQDRSSR